MTIENQAHPLVHALRVIIHLLEEMKIPYMVFGGIANSIYGNPRQTLDIDIKIAVGSDAAIEKLISKIHEKGKVIPQNPSAFITETSVLPIDIEGVRVDLVFARLPFELEAIQRSRRIQYAGLDLPVCTIEDLIIHKVISERMKDWVDIETLIALHKNTLDWQYLMKHCEELASFLDRPEIVQNLKRLKNE